MTRLEDLDLSRNEIQDIEMMRVFVGMKQIQKLNLTGNKVIKQIGFS